MSEPTLAELAETAGYMVFKIGAAGTLLGLVAGTMVATGEAGWQPMQNWFTLSMAVTVAGALMGSIGDFSQPAKRRCKAAGSDIAEPASPPPALAAKPRMPELDRPLPPRISAFRPAPKAGLR